MSSGETGVAGKSRTGGWRSITAALIGIAVLVVVAGTTVGCDGSAQAGPLSADAGAFVTDRVVAVRIAMKAEDWTALRTNAQAEEYVRADFWFDGELVPDVAVRPKGNSSLRTTVASGSPRLGLKVDFNLFNRARNFRGLRKVNLNNGFSDPTLIRECLAYELFDQMGIPTPRASHVDLWVNDTHLGVYTMVEQIDKTFLGRHFPEDDGNLYKPEMLAAPLDWTEAELEEQRARTGTAGQETSDDSQEVNLGGGKLSEIMQALEQQEPTEASTTVQPNLPPGMLPPEGVPRPGMPLPEDMPPDPGAQPGQARDYLALMGLKTNENSPDHSALLHLLDVLNNEPADTFPAEIEKALDVDEALRFLAVSTVTVHLDNYLGSGHNYYLYEVDGRFTMIPWDLNMAFGTFNCNIDREGIIDFFIDEPTCGALAERPLVERLLSHRPYMDAYHGYLESLLNGPFSVDTMQSRIDELSALIRPFVEADALKFFSTRDFERSHTEDMQGVQPPPGIPMGDVPQRQVPQNAPSLSPESLSCLRRQFPGATLAEMLAGRLSPGETEQLRHCLTTERRDVSLHAGQP